MRSCQKIISYHSKRIMYHGAEPSQPPPTSRLPARPYGAAAWIWSSPSCTSGAAGIEMALPGVCPIGVYPIKQSPTTDQLRENGVEEEKRIGTRLSVAPYCLSCANVEDSRHGDSRNGCESSFSKITLCTATAFPIP